jgi:hypothetical protein
MVNMKKTKHLPDAHCRIALAPLLRISAIPFIFRTSPDGERTTKRGIPVTLYLSDSALSRVRSAEKEYMISG